MDANFHKGWTRSSEINFGGSKFRTSDGNSMVRINHTHARAHTHTHTHRACACHAPCTWNEDWVHRLLVSPQKSVGTRTNYENNDNHYPTTFRMVITMAELSQAVLLHLSTLHHCTRRRCRCARGWRSVLVGSSKGSGSHWPQLQQAAGTAQNQQLVTRTVSKQLTINAQTKMCPTIRTQQAHWW